MMNSIFLENVFRLEVDTGSGGYGFIDTLEELLEDVEKEFGNETKTEVEEWTRSSKEGDQFEKYGMVITNIGK